MYGVLAINIDIPHHQYTPLSIYPIIDIGLLYYRYTPSSIYLIINIPHHQYTPSSIYPIINIPHHQYTPSSIYPMCIFVITEWLDVILIWLSATWISWFPWLRFCGHCRNLEFTITIRHQPKIVTNSVSKTWSRSLHSNCHRAGAYSETLHYMSSTHSVNNMSLCTKGSRGFDHHTFDHRAIDHRAFDPFGVLIIMDCSAEDRCEEQLHLPPSLESRHP